jgi:hypothetical protein
VQVFLQLCAGVGLNQRLCLLFSGSS